jgi:Uma2 family endonuclease
MNMPPQIEGVTRRLFTPEECLGMLDAGILSQDEGVAIRHGELFVPRAGRRHGRSDSGESSGTRAVAGDTAPEDVRLEDVRFQDGSVATNPVRQPEAKREVWVRRRFNVDEYYALAHAGILGPDERVELLAGEIVKMAPIGSRHAFCVRELSKRFHSAIGDGAIISVQAPVRLAAGNEPEPDIAVLHPREDGYASAHPGLGDVLLVIEVSDTSVGFDRRHKVPMYAAHGIPEVWLFDLNSRSVEIYDAPWAGGYTTLRSVASGDNLTLSAFPDVTIPVCEVMPLG